MERFENVTGLSKRLVALLLVAAAAGCGGGGGGGGTEAPPPVVPVVNLAPTVSGTLTANGATNVAVNTKVGVTFSEPMDPASINATTFFLMRGATPVPATTSYTGVSAILAPSADLAPSTRYTATIKGGAGGARDLSGNPLVGDFVWSWTTRATPDTTAPTVTGTIHVNGATNIAINTKVGATFSEAMDPLTVTTATFFLTQGTAVVPATVTYAGVSALLVPSANLTPLTRYVVTVKGGAGGVKDLAGNALARDFVLAWTTGQAGDTVAPIVTGTTNANGATSVAINTKVGATFSEAMDPLTVTAKSFLLARGTTAVPATVAYSGVTALLIPLDNLAPATGYTATLRGGSGGVKDLAGNPMTGDYAWSWTTGTTPDSGAPTVTATTIPNGATNIPVSVLVAATFSEGMDPLTVTNVTCTLVETGSGELAGGRIVTYSGLEVQFLADSYDFGPLPASSLKANTSYTVTIRGGIDGVLDLAGNPMASDYTWTFMTGAAAQ
ncbi:MAG: Ig-like domain-containing protein [Betaproteobacteria bacterium]|nr:Ig-like domain-containing protein [Betaproteobacteria bacterium]